MYKSHLYQRSLFFVSCCLLLLLAACGSNPTSNSGPPGSNQASTPTSASGTSGQGATPAAPGAAGANGIVFANKDHTDKVPGIAWSPDGKYIASGSADKTVQVIDAVTGKLVYTYKGHT